MSTEESIERIKRLMAGDKSVGQLSEGEMTLALVEAIGMLTAGCEALEKRVAELERENQRRDSYEAEQREQCQ